jgi:phosphoesterase RecJ-like protein
MPEDNFDRLIELINASEDILLLPHIYADGDALGSCGALSAFLGGMGKRTTVLIQEPVESKLAFLPRVSGVSFTLFGEADPAGKRENGDEDGKVNDAVIPDRFDLAIAVDSSTPDRLGGRLRLYEKAKEKARIDHHAAGTDFAPLTLLDPAWSATAEGVYLLLNRMGFDRGDDTPEWITPELSRAVAACIYTALVTDTGCFAFSNVTAQTHYIASRARALSGNMSYVYHHVFEVKSMAYARLMKAVYEKIEFPAEGIAALVLTKEDFEAAGAGDEDAEGIANVLRSIEGIHVGIFIKPDKVPGKYRVSMRSDEFCDVAKIASAFGGGGHVCASGCGFAARNPEELSKAKAALIDAARELIEGSARSDGAAGSV